MASIVVVTGTSRGNYLALQPRVMTIGRDERSDMQVLDERVSRRHVEIVPSGSGYAIRDVSSNGVLLNGSRMEATTTLADADVILIGGSKLVFTTKPIHDQQAALTFAAHGERDKRTIGPDRQPF